MTYTIAVERKSPDEKFTAEDLKLFHQECVGGEIDQTATWGGWNLHCRRCHMRGSVEESDNESNNGILLMVKTAIDGESRQIKQIRTSGQRGDDIRVILKP